MSCTCGPCPANDGAQCDCGWFWFSGVETEPRWARKPHCGVHEKAPTGAGAYSSLAGTNNSRVETGSTAPEGAVTPGRIRPRKVSGIHYQTPFGL